MCQVALYFETRRVDAPIKERVLGASLRKHKPTQSSHIRADSGDLWTLPKDGLSQNSNEFSLRVFTEGRARAEGGILVRTPGRWSVCKERIEHENDIKCLGSRGDREKQCWCFTRRVLSTLEKGFKGFHAFSTVAVFRLVMFIKQAHITVLVLRCLLPGKKWGHEDTD